MRSIVKKATDEALLDLESALDKFCNSKDTAYVLLSDGQENKEVDRIFQEAFDDLLSAKEWIQAIRDLTQ